MFCEQINIFWQITKKVPQLLDCDTFTRNVILVSSRSKMILHSGYGKFIREYGCFYNQQGSPFNNKHIWWP